MRCPYCASDIHDEALACPHCTRDLYLFKPLLARLDAQEAAIASLSARLDDLGTALAAQHRDPAADLPAADGATPARIPATLARHWLAPLALLLLAHVLVVVLYDARALWLHVLALLIPAPFGYALVRRAPRQVGPWVAGAVLLALAAVLGMSAVTALLDGTPVLPATLRDWQEFIEFAASIALSYLAGMALGRRVAPSRAARWMRASAEGAPAGFAGSMETHLRQAARMEEAARRMHRMVNSVMALGAALAAAYTGLKGVVGE